MLKPEKVRNLTNSYVGDFVGFQTDIEHPVHMHSAVHVMMGGDLGGELLPIYLSLFPPPKIKEVVSQENARLPPRRTVQGDPRFQSTVCVLVIKNRLLSLNLLRASCSYG